MGRELAEREPVARQLGQPDRPELPYGKDVAEPRGAPGGATVGDFASDSSPVIV